jgi:succinylglutamate desuccinylase
MKILLLGSQHGNELLGERLHAHIKSERPELLPHVTFMIGNLRAHKQNVRYLESDMNRSYNGKSNTYEERRASRVLKSIKDEAYDLVLDLHTTTCKQPPCFIAPGTATGISRFMRASSIENVVQMSHSIVTTSLIGAYDKAISIEVNKVLSRKLLNDLCDDIQRYINDETLDLPKKIYEINDLLKKADITTQQAKTLRNFEYSELGFYPVLVGENSYKKHTEYLGFKAYKVRVCKV